MQINLLKKLRSYFTLVNGVLLLALFVAFGCVWGAVGALQKNFALQQKVDALTQENALYELANETQRFQNKYFESREYLELNARDHLNKASPDEKLLILPVSTATTPPDPNSAQPVKLITKLSNLDQWMYFLFGQKR